jgi:hypothetical protein
MSMRQSTKNAVKWLNANYRKHPEWLAENFYFDYPEYGGMPRKLSSRLTSDAVDAIQEAWPSGCKAWNGAKFRSALRDFSWYDM